MLELLSGEEATMYHFDRGRKELVRVSTVEMATEAAGSERVRS